MPEGEKNRQGFLLMHAEKHYVYGVQLYTRNLIVRIKGFREAFNRIRNSIFTAILVS